MDQSAFEKWVSCQFRTDIRCKLNQSTVRSRWNYIIKDNGMVYLIINQPKSRVNESVGVGARYLKTMNMRCHLLEYARVTTFQRMIPFFSLGTASRMMKIRP